MGDGGKPEKPDEGASWRLGSLGTELAAAVAGGCLVGYWVDVEFNTGHWGLVIGASIGIVGGLYNLIRKALHESIGAGGPGSRSKTGGADSCRRKPPSAGGGG